MFEYFIEMGRTQKRKGVPDNNRSECKCIIHEQLTRDKTPKRKYTVSSKDYSKMALK